MEFAEYVVRQRPALMRFATVLTCQAWLAEDLVSDVLGRAFERWDRISGMDQPNAYVRRMVVNEYLSWHRRLTPTSGSTDSASPPTTTGLPATPEELIDRLTVILGGTATFTVTERGPGANVVPVPPPPTGQQDNLPPSMLDVPTPDIGAGIVGTMTAGSLTGGFDIVVYPGDGTADEFECECTKTMLPDGSWLVTSMTILEAPGGLTNRAELVRPNGDTISMHVSNNTSAKGNGDVIAPNPPLTIDQMVAIVKSELWW